MADSGTWPQEQHQPAPPRRLWNTSPLRILLPPFMFLSSAGLMIYTKGQYRSLEASTLLFAGLSTLSYFV